jgi:hypothetical protein
MPDRKTWPTALYLLNLQTTHAALTNPHSATATPTANRIPLWNAQGKLAGDILGNAATVTGGVYTTGNQTIAGIKTFSSAINSNVTGTAITLGTPVATTSGTSVSFSPPAWAKEIKIFFVDVSLSGTDEFLLRIGPAAGVESDAYTGRVGTIYANPSYGAEGHTTAFKLVDSNFGVASYLWSGVFTLSLADPATNTWLIEGSISSNTAASMHVVVGKKSMGGPLAALLIFPSGTNVFDAGKINVAYH